jgi:hypothetical protein
MKGICLLTQIPVRKEPSHKSEMTSQLLFGELFDIMDERNDFINIRIQWDHYEGWIDSTQATRLNEKEFQLLSSSTKGIIAEPFVYITIDGNSTLVVPAGGIIYELNYSQFEVKGKLYQFAELPTAPKDICTAAKKFMNSPYLWGGKTCFGLDCSGFTQVIYKTRGISIPRDCSDQVHSGESVSLISESLPGDLAFFDDEEGNITHVGMLLSPEQIIHASGKVRIDNIDHQGIYNQELSKYTHKLRTIRRMVV